MSTLKNHIDLRNVRAVFSPENKIIDAVNFMYRHNASFVILQKDQNTVGIFTQSDLKNRVVAKQLDPTQIKLLDVMTKNPNTFDINDTLAECLSKIGTKKIGHLPILSKGKLVAVLSKLKVLQLAFHELAEEREQLIHYITGESAACS